MNTMKFCPNCDKANLSGSNFCPECGAQIMLIGWEENVVEVNTKEVQTVDQSLCPNCMVTIVSGSNFCPECGAGIPRIKGRGWKLNVAGVNAKEVQSIAHSLVNNMSDKDRISAFQSPWLSGSFYLIAVVVIVTLFLVAARTLNIVVLPIIIIGALLTVAIIGAFQLRQDKVLSEKNFLTLMFLTFKQLPFISRKNNTKKKSH